MPQGHWRDGIWYSNATYVPEIYRDWADWVLGRPISRYRDLPQPRSPHTRRTTDLMDGSGPVRGTIAELALFAYFLAEYIESDHNGIMIGPYA